MHLRRKFSPFSAFLPLAAALLLSGCFGDDPGAAGADPQASSRIRVVMLLPPRAALSPFSDDAFKLSRWSSAETLVQLDALGNAQPSLATRWERLDGHSWRFSLREGVRFHQGSTLTSADVVRSLTAATRAAPKPRILDGVQMSVEAEGEYGVIVRTAVDDPLLPQRLSSPQLVILAPSAYREAGVVSPIEAGTGPFVLTRLEGTSSATLERFDDYWGEPARSPGIDVDFVPDPTARGAALRTGRADVIEAIPVSQAVLLDPALVHEVPMPRTNTLYLNTARGVFSDPALRAAARDAIDPQTIVANVYEGRADVAAGLLGPALPWAAQGRRALPRTPLAAPPAGAEILLGTFTDRAELPEVAVHLQQQLEAAGFRVTQELREYAHIEADALAGRFDAFILSRATVLDSGDPVAYLYSDFACEGSFNIAQLCDPAVDEALRRAASIPAGDQRRAAILAAEAQILATNAALPMLHERVIQGESARVALVERDPRERRLITQATHIQAARGE